MNLNDDFDRVSAMLARVLGAPTDTAPLDSFTRRRHAWTKTSRALNLDTHAVVALDGRGVVVWASGPGTAFHGHLHTNHMVVAPSGRMLARIERGEAACPTVTTVEAMHIRTRERWRGPLSRTTPEVAVEAVRALVAGELAT